MLTNKNSLEQLAEKTGMTFFQIRRWMRREELKTNQNFDFKISNIVILENHFSVETKPEPNKIKELAQLTGISYKRVYMWFAHQRERRAKENTRKEK
jgi:hypothetical protein